MFKIYGKLFSYIPKEKKIAYLAIFATFIAAVFTAVGNYYLYEFLDRLVVQKNIDATLKTAYVIVALLVIGGLIYFGALLLTHAVGFRIETNLRKRGIDGLLGAGFKFFDKHQSGKVRKIIDDNAEQTHTIVAHLIPDLMNAVVAPILTLIIAFIVNWKIGVLLIVVILVGVILIKSFAGNQDNIDRYMTMLENLNGESVEYIRGMQIIKIFGISVFSFKSLHKAITSYADAALEHTMKCRPGFVAFQVLFNGVVALIIPIMLFFTDYKSYGDAIVVDLIFFLVLLGVMFNALMKVMYVSMYQYLGERAVDSIEGIYNEMQEDKLIFGNEEEFENFNIEFDNVSFGYNEKMILEDLSFTLDEKKIYAFVGSSGSGKSTIAKLISGFYNINKGAIRIGGKSLTEYSEKAIMKNIAFVFQDAKLFKMSIIENVMLGNPNATKEEALEALKAAGCQGILEKFSNRENTVIGSKGVFLSGGEKQRIAIARGILKNAGIIIMDEACAATDPENEHELQKAFSNLMENKTVIMIAHRLPSIKGVDEILVLSDGKIVERGNNQELIGVNGRYKYLQDLYEQANQWGV